MNKPDISEAQYAQGDVMRAVDAILDHKLPLDEKGAAKAEHVIREHGEGNRTLWPNPNYLRSTVYLAQEIVRAVRKGGRGRG